MIRRTTPVNASFCEVNRLMKSTSDRPSAMEKNRRVDESPRGDLAKPTFEARCREALVLWLRWNESYEHVTEVMCQPGKSQEQLERHMDQMDALRRQAVAISRELFDQAG